MTYRSFFDIKKLVGSAQTELSASDPEADKAFLWASMAGLRRAEIDQLDWSAFDWQHERLHICVTEHLAVKSQGSTGDADLDRELVRLFKDFYKVRAAAFSARASEAEVMRSGMVRSKLGQIGLQ